MSFLTVLEKIQLQEKFIMSTRLFRCALTALLISISLACSLFTSAPAPSQAEIEKEEQAVYAFFVGEGTGTSLILEETASGLSTDDIQQTREYIKSGLPDLSRETLNSFMERNQQPTPLSPDMQLGVEYELLSHEYLAEISSQPNWNEILNERYSGSNGYLILSRVGFNKSLDQAVIYVGQVAGPLMGSGSYYMLEKENGEWILKEQANIWIS